ncbi:unnamed protein product, partial [Ectocarpus sp. 13 AM-2016]
MMNMIICEGAATPAAFLDPTGFTTKQQQHPNARHVRPLYHQARGSQGRSPPTQDARRTSPVRPLPSSAAGLLLQTASLASNRGLATSSSSSSSSNSRIASTPTTANDLLPSALRNGNVQAAAKSPAGGSVRSQVQQQQRRQRQQELQEQTGSSGLSSTS